MLFTGDMGGKRETDYSFGCTITMISNPAVYEEDQNSLVVAHDDFFFPLAAAHQGLSWLNHDSSINTIWIHSPNEMTSLLQSALCQTLDLDRQQAHLGEMADL